METGARERRGRIVVVS